MLINYSSLRSSGLSVVGEHTHLATNSILRDVIYDVMRSIVKRFFCNPENICSYLISKDVWRDGAYQIFACQFDYGASFMFWEEESERTDNIEAKKPNVFMLRRDFIFGKATPTPTSRILRALKIVRRYRNDHSENKRIMNSEDSVWHQFRIHMANMSA